MAARECTHGSQHLEVGLLVHPHLVIHPIPQAPPRGLRRRLAPVRRQIHKRTLLLLRHPGPAHRRPHRVMPELPGLQSELHRPLAARPHLRFLLQRALVSLRTLHHQLHPQFLRPTRKIVQLHLPPRLLRRRVNLPRPVPVGEKTKRRLFQRRCIHPHPAGQTTLEAVISDRIGKSAVIVDLLGQLDVQLRGVAETRGDSPRVQIHRHDPERRHLPVPALDLHPPRPGRVTRRRRQRHRLLGIDGETRLGLEKPHRQHRHLQRILVRRRHHPQLAVSTVRHPQHQTTRIQRGGRTPRHARTAESRISARGLAEPEQARADVHMIARRSPRRKKKGNPVQRLDPTRHRQRLLVQHSRGVDNLLQRHRIKTLRRRLVSPHLQRRQPHPGGNLQQHPPVGRRRRRQLQEKQPVAVDPRPLRRHLHPDLRPDLRRQRQRRVIALGRQTKLLVPHR